MAALLSFVWPGLGQLYRGRRRTGIALALPIVLLVAAVAVLAAQGGAELFALRLLSPPVALAALGLTVLMGAWRVVAIAGAARSESAVFGFGSRGRLFFSLALIVAVVACHAAAAMLAWSFFRAGSAIFQELPPVPPPLAAAGPEITPTLPRDVPEQRPTRGGGEPSPDAPSRPTSQPLNIPTDPLPPAPSRPLPGAELPSRTNVLLVGLDTGSGGNNTDTLIVASFDTQSDSIVMISLPRDTAMFRLYDGRTYTSKVGSFMNHAARNPKHFPDGGMAALVRQMEFLIGVDIHHYASIDIAGFRRMIELAGGVDVTVERRISDPTYKLGLGPEGFHLEPGEHHLDSWQALAYVRSRMGTNGSDFERAERQQQVLLALRHKINDPQVLANLPALLEAASQTVRTDVPVELLPQLLGLLQGSLEADVENIVLGPPTYSQRIPKAEIRGLYALQLDMEQVARLSRRVFGDDSSYSR